VITPHDELLIHQLPTTLDHVSQSDLRWTERIVMYGFDKTGEISIMTGLAKYPNRNVLDAYAMVTRKGEEARVVRLSTELNPQTGGLAAWSVGPYTYEIVEPLRQVRSTVDANEHGLSLQLDFHGDFPVYEQTAAFHPRAAAFAKTPDASTRTAPSRVGSKSTAPASTSIPTTGGSAAITRGAYDTAVAAAVCPRARTCSRPRFRTESSITWGYSNSTTR